MSGAAGLDLRYPIGALFSILGLIIGGYGLATNGDTSHYARSEALNINLWWGLVMLAFGLLLLFLARRGGPTVRPTANSPEGLATEAREHRRGLEHER